LNSEIDTSCMVIILGHGRNEWSTPGL
jgi:hypothetical protein